MAQQVLTQFQDHPDAWTRVPDILETSAYPQAKVRLFLLTAAHISDSNLHQYIGLQILEKLITTRWKSLPEGQRQGMNDCWHITTD